MIDCCAAIQVPGAGLRLHECYEVHDGEGEPLQLHRCPGCGALWLSRDICRGHGEWARSFSRTESRESFEALIHTPRKMKGTEPALPPRSKPLTPSDVARAFDLALKVVRAKNNEQ